MIALQRVSNFIQSEDGPTAVEYAVLLALIVVVTLPAVRAVGTNASEKFDIINGTTSAAATYAVGDTSPGYTDVPAEGKWQLNLSDGTTVNYDAATGEETTNWAGGGTQSSNIGAGHLGSDRGQLWTRTE